jgi:hypothetical protein
MDPIGLAGGLNVYGFAGGDPINLSDPFGLCPMCIPVVVAGAPVVIAGAAILAGTQAPDLSPLGEAIGERWDGLRGKGREWASDAWQVLRGRNKIPLVGGPPNGIATRPGVSVRYGPDGNATTRTCARPGHGCDGPHTHEYVTGPNGQLNQRGQPRPATEEEIKETPPPNQNE